MNPDLSENDRVEIERFRLYLQACLRWNQAFDDVPEFAPQNDAEILDNVRFEKRRIKAHAAIYEQIYGEKP